MRREASAAQAHQAAVLHRLHQAVLVGDGGRHTGRVHRLLAVRLDGDGRGHGTVDHPHGRNILHHAGHAGVDVGADKAAGLADERANHDGVALFDDWLRRSADVHRHGNDDVLGNWHLDRCHPGCRLLMRDTRTLRGAFQGFEHGTCFPHFFVEAFPLCAPSGACAEEPPCCFRQRPPRSRGALPLHQKAIIIR